MGVGAFGYTPEKIVFAAFAGWDAAGAKSFGYPTFWVNRQNSVEEQLGAHPDATGIIDELVKFAIA
jgi:2-haloacid dehalogenase